MERARSAGSSSAALGTELVVRSPEAALLARARGMCAGSGGGGFVYVNDFRYHDHGGRARGVGDLRRLMAP
jgi:hypothetical protein